MASNRADVIRVPLPAGVKASSVVGRGGQNVKWLHLQSGGAHITVNDTGVVIRTKDNVVRARAEQLVRRQLEVAASIASQNAFAGARTELVLLDSAFGANPCVCFQQRQDEVTQASGYRDKLYHLIPQPYDNTDSSEYGTRGCDAAALSPSMSLHFARASSASDGGSSTTSTVSRDEVTERDQDLDVAHPAPCRRRRLHTTTSNASSASSTSPHRLSDSGGGAMTQRFHIAVVSSSSISPAITTAPCTSLPSTLPLADVVTALGAAVHVAAHQQQPYPCESLKLKFKLGKALFRNLAPRAVRSALRISDLQALSNSGNGGRAGFLSTWSNGVPAAAVPRVTDWLTRHLGFRLVTAKCSVALHVINQELNVPYRVGLVLQNGQDASACLRKLKAGGGRSLALALMSGPDEIDVRLKLDSRHSPQQAALYDNDAAITAQRAAAAVRSEGFHGFMRSRRGLPRHRHLEYGRRTSKCVYEGSFQLPSADDGGSQVSPQAQRMRVSVCRVEDDSGEHWEVSGSLPDLDVRLSQLLRWRPRPSALLLQSQSCLGSQSRGALCGGPGGQVCPSGADRDGQGVAEGVAEVALATLTAFMTQINAHVKAAEAPQCL